MACFGAPLAVGRAVTIQLRAALITRRSDRAPRRSFSGLLAPIPRFSEGEDNAGAALQQGVY